VRLSARTVDKCNTVTFRLKQLLVVKETTINPSTVEGLSRMMDRASDDAAAGAQNEPRGPYRVAAARPSRGTNRKHRALIRYYPVGSMAEWRSTLGARVQGSIVA